MRTLLVALVVLLAACGGGGGSAYHPEETLTELCVRLYDALWEKHDLEQTHPDSEQPRICDEFMEEQGITNKAELQITVRKADQELTALNTD
jgi:hypothetical protein